MRPQKQTSRRSVLSRLLPLGLVAATVALSVTLRSAGAEDVDLIIRSGRIIDGSGNPAYYGDVAVKGGRIVQLGKVTGGAVSELDARGMVVTPGFIDVHVHTENIASLPEAENFVRMGVTSLVTGNCGGSALDVKSFFERIEEKGVSVNVATLFGHNTARREAMGGSFRREPTADELQKMRQYTEQAMKDGAVGLSTGLIYLPGTYSKTDEIIELAKVASQYDGIYASHMRNEGSGIFTALDELFRISREAKIRAEISHIKLSGNSAWGKSREVLAVVDRARAEGLDVTQDQYAYTASSTNLGTLIPSEAREGGDAEFNKRIADPEQKAKIVAEMKENIRKGMRGDYSYAVIANYPADRSLNGKSIAEAAKIKRGANTLDDQIELIIEIEQKGGGSGVFHGMNEDDLQEFLRHPNTMVASDSGVREMNNSVPHPRGYGNNARVLARYVRELKVLRLEDAIRRMTSLPASAFRLEDRGLLRPGAWADLVVFDPAKVQDTSTYTDPHHYSVGFTHVLVNGVPVVKDGEHTHARPGKALRHRIPGGA